MKNIVTVKRDNDNALRIYELPEGVVINAGERVKVEYRDRETTATAYNDSIVIADDVLQYVLATPLKKVTATLTEYRFDWGTEQDGPAEATETATDDD